MKNYLIDTHAHIDMLPLDETLNLMQEYNVKKAIIPSVEIGTMDKVLEIANNNENIYAMLGIFPSEAKTYTNDVEEKIRKLNPLEMTPLDALNTIFELKRDLDK